jgi:hypothetical protein
MNDSTKIYKTKKCDEKYKKGKKKIVKNNREKSEK